MWRAFVWCWKVMKQYLSNCNIHGVKYLVNDQLSYPERLFWLVSCVACWYGCAIMIHDVLRNYIEYPVAVTIESMFLHWVTPYPTIAICISNSKTIKNNYFKRNPGMLGNFSNQKLLQATSEELLSAYEQMRFPCADLLDMCTWNNRKFNCCSEFQELQKTGIGYCLAMNTYHLGEDKLRYFINGSTKYGDLVIDVYSGSKPELVSTAVSVHMLNNLGLPMIDNFEMEQTVVKNGKMNRIEFTMYDMYNEPGVKYVAIEPRDCQFRHEKQRDSMFAIYSSDTCYLQMIIERMVKFCGCVNFYYYAPKGTRVCNGTEMLCIIANKSEIASEDLRSKLCQPNCEGTAIYLNRWDPHDYDSPTKSHSRFHFTMLSHPTIRYRRYVVYDLLDVIVSVGSAVGLFMGASILSIFEIPYWLFIRRDKIR
ncbi:pickpocket 13 [Lasioglossum baleicum]|uniref:pickpocket 13 n=1 Tax=Lasioglossum baleicum TaxID=434251 RepID=UPI003FCD69A4